MTGWRRGSRVAAAILAWLSIVAASVAAVDRWYLRAILPWLANRHIGVPPRIEPEPPRRNPRSAPIRLVGSELLGDDRKMWKGEWMDLWPKTRGWIEVSFNDDRKHHLAASRERLNFSREDRTWQASVAPDTLGTGGVSTADPPPIRIRPDQPTLTCEMLAGEDWYLLDVTSGKFQRRVRKCWVLWLLAGWGLAVGLVLAFRTWQGRRPVTWVMVFVCLGVLASGFGVLSRG